LSSRLERRLWRRRGALLDRPSLASGGARGRLDPGARAQSCLRELPEGWLDDSFNREPAGEWRVGSQYLLNVHLARQDIRRESPSGLFHLILCRNLVFTYFDDKSQGQVLTRLFSKLEPGGALVLGSHEKLPTGEWGLLPWDDAGSIFRKISD
jgi:chemotaxis protein methyltransferase CheR